MGSINDKKPAALPVKLSGKRIPGQVKILGYVSLFTDIASEMLYPVTPIFLTAVLGSSMAVVGLMAGLAEVTAGFLKGYFGFLSDKLKKRSIFVTTGYALSAVSKPLPGLLPQIGIVLGSRITDRIGKGIRTAPRDALLGSYSENNSGAIFGFHRGMDTLGAALGPLISILLLQAYNNNYRLIFLIAFIPSVFAVGFTFLVKDKAIVKPAKEKLKVKEFWRDAPKRYKSVLILLVLFAFVNSSDVFLILRSVNVAGSAAAGIAAYILYNIVYAASSYPAGRLSDKYGKKNILAAGLFVFSIVYAGFAFASGTILLFILFGTYGIYAAATEGISKAWISDLIPDHQRGSAIGLLTMLVSFASLTGSFITGLLWDYSGPWLPFLISSIVSLFIAVTFLLIRQQETKTPPSM